MFSKMVESQWWFFGYKLDLFGKGFVIFAIKGPPYAAMTTSSTTHSSCRGGHNVARSTPFGLSGPACTGFSWKNMALYLHYLPWRRHLAAGATGSTRRSGGSGIERGGDIHPVSIYEGSLSWNKGIRYSSFLFLLTMILMLHTISNDIMVDFIAILLKSCKSLNYIHIKIKG